MKTQIADVEARIELEVESFSARHPGELKQERPPERETNSTSKETVGEPHTESPSISNVIDATNSTTVQVPQSDHVTAGKESLEEHNGEVVVEAEEDTVIY
jgi:hypothetical protein